VCALALPAQAQYSGGSGTTDDPYQIATAADLIALGETPADYDKHFVLTADIDLDPNLPGGRVFDRAVIAPDIIDTTLSFEGTPFTGVFEGDGHLISNMTIAGVNRLGLFGCIGRGAVITDLGLVDVDVNGTGSYIGGLAGGTKWGGTITTSHSDGTVRGEQCAVGGLLGYNGGSITTSYSIGMINGDWHVGGLVGRNWGGSITTSYSTATVSGTGTGVGGLVGDNSSEGCIANSYSMGTVRVSGGGAAGGFVGSNGTSGIIAVSYSAALVEGEESVGGLVGESGSNATVTSSFWDMEASNQLASSGGTGLTTAEIQEIDIFLKAGWDFVDEVCNGTCDYWQISPGDYPRLRYHIGVSPVMPTGAGTAEEPYLIRDAEDLGTVWFEPTAHYRLEASVDLSGITWPTAVVPVFGGNFDGSGCAISDVHIQGAGYLGLFGRLGPRGVVSNLGLEAVDVSGIACYIAGLASWNEGSITLSYSSGTTDGDDYVGGLTGCNWGSIATSHSDGMVNGNGHDSYGGVGGLVGSNRGDVVASYSGAAVTGSGWHIGGLAGYSDGNVTASGNTGTISGHQYVGGLVGENEGDISTSYNTGVVSGDYHVGGLVGFNHFSWSAVGLNGEASVTQCFNTGMVNANSHVGGLAGYIDAYSPITFCYNTGSVSGTSAVGGLIGVYGIDCTGGRREGHCWGATVSQSYSAGSVIGDSSVGGLIGDMDPNCSADITACFWDTEISRQPTGPDGIALPTADMQTAATFLNAGWDFVDETDNGPNDIWMIVEGQTYPLLSWQKYGGGTGEPNDPYLIYTAEHLNALGAEPNDYDKHFKLVADIDLSGCTYNRAVIAGAFEAPFTGVFDGNDHTISHLTIEGESHLGLFGELSSGAEVVNLGVVDVNIVGSSYAIGGLVGSTYHGTVRRCHSTGAIRGDSSVGGLAGSMVYGDLRECYSTATVTGSGPVGGLVGNIGRSSVKECFGGGAVSGNKNVGGLVGWASQTFIANSYSTGAVSGYSRVGGLVGGLGLEGGVSFCYSTGVVSGNDNVGGLVGAGASTWNRSSGPVDGCFWDTQTSGCVSSYGHDGGTGLTTAEMQTASTFLEAGWDFIDETANGTDDIWWILEGQDYPRLWWEMDEN